MMRTRESARRVRLLAPLLVLLLALPGCLSKPQDAAPPVDFEGIRFEVDVDATHHGAFTVIVWPNETPATVAFMKKLVTQGYYDKREFTRVIPGFVIQQTDRTGGATDTTETIPLEAGRNVTFSAGALGIARGELPDSGGPEFFVMDFANTSTALYGNYTAWGQVVDGLDVVHAIARVPAVRNPACGNAQTAGVACFLGVPGVPFSTFDQEAVSPPVITSARWTHVALPASVAARYPLQSAPAVVVGGLRMTLEWPHDLRAGQESPLTWYVWNRPADGVTDKAPDLSTAYVFVDNQTIQARPDAADARILHFAWSPPAAGSFAVELRNATATMARVNVTVPS